MTTDTYFRGADSGKDQLAHVRFKTVPVEDREATQREGRAIMKDEVFAYIYPRGGKDVVKKRVFNNNGQFNPDLMMYEGHYEAWKKGEEPPVEGTDIRNFAILSPAQIENLRSFHIYTVEQLAEANEETLKNIGPGTRTLKKKAEDYLNFGKDGGKATEEINSLRAQLESQQTENSKLAEQVEGLNRAVAELTEKKGKKR